MKYKDEMMQDITNLFEKYKALAEIAPEVHEFMITLAAVKANLVFDGCYSLNEQIKPFMEAQVLAINNFIQEIKAQQN